MHSCPRIIPLSPTSSRTEHVCVGPADFAGGGGGLEAGAVASIGTPEGSPPVSHHEYVVPLTVPLPMPATTSPAQEHSVEGELIPMLEIGATLQVNNFSLTNRKKIGMRMLQLTL